MFQNGKAYEYVPNFSLGTLNGQQGAFLPALHQISA